MKPILFNILAVIIGLFIGGAANMGIVMISDAIIAPPAGANLTTEEGLIAAMPLMEPKHFLMPFLAHALGTLVGAILTAFIAATNKMPLSMTIGVLFLIGGIMAVSMIPAPLWFCVVDLVFAYVPMAYLGWKIAGSKK
jgi:hypothetical protein